MGLSETALSPSACLLFKVKEIAYIDSGACRLAVPPHLQSQADEVALL